MAETLKDGSEEVSQDNNLLHLPVETVFHGTSVETAKSILKEGFSPKPHADRPDLGPVSWFTTESLMASGYGGDSRVRDDEGMLTTKRNPKDSPDAPTYSVIVEAEIPKSSDPRGFNTFENGIEYVGLTRIVTEHGIGNVAIKAMRLYEHKPAIDGMPDTYGTLIDEYILQQRPSFLKRMRDKIRRKKNTMLGRPTL